MSEKVKVADAKFGEWYDMGGDRLRCIEDDCSGRLRSLFAKNRSELSWLDSNEELTHLPDCTGWHWQPPAPEPDTSLEASILFIERTGMSLIEREHVDRIIAAARKWDESQGGASTATASEVTNEKGSGVRDAARPESNDPDDPSPEWTDELIRLCERMTYLRDGAKTYWIVAKIIGEHLNKRGER